MIILNIDMRIVDFTRSKRVEVDVGVVLILTHQIPPGHDAGGHVLIESQHRRGSSDCHSHRVVQLSQNRF